MLPDIPTVTAYSPKGKILVATLRVLLRGVHLLRGKVYERPPQYFHEDARRFKVGDMPFFAYKYYFKPPLKSDNAAEVEHFFQQNPPTFTVDKTKVISEVTLTAAGDLMCYEWIQKRFCPHLWDDIQADFFSSDLTFANLETPIDVSKPVSYVPEVMLTDMNFNANEEMFDIFQGAKSKRQDAKGNGQEARGKGQEAKGNEQNANSKRQGVGDTGFDVLSTANNHSLDMGEEGVFKTIAFLENKKIAFTGTARSANERDNCPIIEKNGIKIAFIAYTFSMNKFVNPTDKPFLVNHLEVNQPDVDLSPLKRDVALAHERGAEFVILSLHFSNAYQAYPNAHIVKNAQRIFDECGVDMILGGHAHNVQPMARYDFRCPFSWKQKAGFVLFSFSDFVAYDIFNGCHLSVYLKIVLSKVQSALANDENTEGGNEVVLSNIEVVPVYACGVYRTKNDRDLRLLDAKKWLSKIQNGDVPHFMTAWNVTELTRLMAFYENYFAKNLLEKSNFTPNFKAFQ